MLHPGTLGGTSAPVVLPSRDSVAYYAVRSLQCCDHDAAKEIVTSERAAEEASHFPAAT